MAPARRPALACTAGPQAEAYCTLGNYRAQVVEAALDAALPGTPADLKAREQAVLAALDQRRANGTPYVVMGRPARNVTVTQALSCVAGYCTVNDLTLRQRVIRSDLPAMGTDFLQANGGPGWLPVGPCLVPAFEIRAPQDLQLRLQLNGQVMQKGCADDMVFSIAEHIAYLSHHVQLQPGDLLCTGSPAGLGQHHRCLLRPGNRLDTEVIGLGSQHLALQAAHLNTGTQRPQHRWRTA